MRFAIVIAMFLITAVGAIAQDGPASHPEPRPAPQPPTKRRTFDQFDLSNGIRVSNAPESAKRTPVTSELVDEHIYEVISQIGESASFCEGQLMVALQRNDDTAPGFRKFLKHRLDGLIVLSETHRLGLLGQGAIKNEENKKLMQETEYAVKEMIAVLETGPQEYAKFGKELNRVTERYSVPLLEVESNGMRLDRIQLMRAIMRRITANFAQLKSQLAIRK